MTFQNLVLQYSPIQEVFMETFLGLSAVIQNHIKQIAKTSGMTEGDETLEVLAQAWEEKRKCFEDGLSENQLEEVSFFSKDEEKGAVALTYSGSLITLGPLVDGYRKADYTSIGLRKDVPSTASEQMASLADDVEVDSVISFTKGPIQRSSPIYKIAVSMEDLQAEEEEALLTQITQDIAEEFVEVNKTIIQ